MRFQTVVAGLAAVSILAGCSASPKSFYANPSKPGATSLCRSFLETDDPSFQSDVGVELVRRGLTLEDCENRIAMETAALAAIAVTAVGIGVAAACSGRNCAAPSFGGSSSGDYDCWGGGGNGPYFVRGPFQITGPDIHGLDADQDGIACEPYDDIGS